MIASNGLQFLSPLCPQTGFLQSNPIQVCTEINPIKFSGIYILVSMFETTGLNLARTLKGKICVQWGWSKGHTIRVLCLFINTVRIWVLLNVLTIPKST